MAALLSHTCRHRFPQLVHDCRVLSPLRQTLSALSTCSASVPHPVLPYASGRDSVLFHRSQRPLLAVFSSVSAVRSMSESTSPSQVIYIGPLTNRIRYLKMFSFLTSTITISFAPFIYNLFSETHNWAALTATLILGTCTLLTPTLIHLVAKNYVTSVRYNSMTDMYTACTISFFLGRLRYQFKASDVIVPELPNMFSNFSVKGRPMFVDGSLMDPVAHYGRLMKFEEDRPIYAKSSRDYVVRKHHWQEVTALSSMVLWFSVVSELSQSAEETNCYCMFCTMCIYCSLSLISWCFTSRWKQWCDVHSISDGTIAIRVRLKQIADYITDVFTHFLFSLCKCLTKNLIPVRLFSM